MTDDYESIVRFNTIDLYVNCDVNVALRINDGDDRSIRVYDIYNVATNKNGTLIVNDIGNFTNVNDRYPTTYEAKYWSRKNMSGIVFNASVVVKYFIKIIINECSVIVVLL